MTNPFAAVDLSVVIPAAKAPPCFNDCLSALFSGEFVPAEVIVVDDAMDKKALQIAGKYPVKVLKNPKKGVASARNCGAEEAKFPVILFIDTDVVVAPDTFKILNAVFKNRKIDGAVGVQCRDLRYSDFFSRFKNQWMRFTYLRLKSNIHLFYTSCAAIRRNVFLELGGFDEKYILPSIEDTVFGASLGQSDRYIVPVHDFEVEHVKKYNIWGVLKTDLTRSTALVRYVLRTLKGHKKARIQKSSVPKRFMFGAICMSIGLLALFLIPFLGLKSIGIFFIVAILTDLLNANWILHLIQEEGWMFAVKACLFIPLDVIFVVIGILTGFITFLLGRKY